jgi:excisionase family DNA binding protein
MSNPKPQLPPDLVDDPRRLLRVPEASAFLGIALKTLYELMADGTLPYVRLRSERRVEMRALQAFIAARRVERR